MTTMHRIVAASGPVGQDTYTIEFSCPWGDCHEVTTKTVPVKNYQAWRNGALAQDAFPNLSADEREVILTGYCATHMAIVFAPPMDDGEDFYYEDEDGDMDEHEVDHALERAHPGDEAYRVDRRVCQGIGCMYGDH